MIDEQTWIKYRNFELKIAPLDLRGLLDLDERIQAGEFEVGQAVDRLMDLALQDVRNLPGQELCTREEVLQTLRICPEIRLFVLNWILVEEAMALAAYRAAWDRLEPALVKRRILKS